MRPSVGRRDETLAFAVISITGQSSEQYSVMLTYARVCTCSGDGLALKPNMIVYQYYGSIALNIDEMETKAQCQGMLVCLCSDGHLVVGIFFEEPLLAAEKELPCQPRKTHPDRSGLKSRFQMCTKKTADQCVKKESDPWITVQIEGSRVPWWKVKY